MKILRALILMLSVSIMAACSDEDIQLISDIVDIVDVVASEQAETPSVSIENKELSSLEFNGKDQVVAINDNRSTFSKDDLSLDDGSWQSLSNLDGLNRVGVADAMLSQELMPKEDREPLHVNPTGWKNKKITVDGKTEWLYNRCHLIGHQFTGENNNLKNLMTCTNSANNPGMLVYENEIAAYIKETNHHVRFQIEPVFKGDELVARGIHMQAKSIEDDKIDFNVYIFNVEKGVSIDYSDGSSKIDK